MSEMLNQEKLTMGSYTQVENVVLDRLMAILSPSEFKVYMAIYRKTIGWGDVVDCLSTSQIMKLTGLSNRVVIQCVKSLKEKLLISVEIGMRGINKITINLKQLHSNSTYDEKSLVTKSHNSPMTNSHSTYDEKSHTKETINKLTKERESSARAQNSESENLNATEVFEFLKKSSVFGSELGIIQHREPNISELNVLIAEVTGYWSGKYLSKQQLLTKILSSVSRKNAQSRIDTYTMPKQQPSLESPVTDWSNRQAGELITEFVAPLPIKGVVRD